MTESRRPRLRGVGGASSFATSSTSSKKTEPKRAKPKTKGGKSKQRSCRESNERSTVAEAGARNGGPGREAPRARGEESSLNELCRSGGSPMLAKSETVDVKSIKDRQER